MANQTVKIKEAKGRPMLTWVGKRPLRQVTAFPAQQVETFDPTGEAGARAGGLLLHGDNKEALAWLLANGYRGKVKLIYIDPPFNTGVDYVRKITPRGIKTEKIRGEEYTFTEQTQYVSNLSTEMFMQFLYERLQLAKEILAPDGIIFIRMDVHYVSHLRLLTDEVFSPDLFQNQIVINRVKKNVTDKGKRTIPHANDFLLVYFKSLDAQLIYTQKKLKRTKAGYWHSMESPGLSGPRQAIIKGTVYYPSPGTHFKFPQAQVDEKFASGEIRINPNTNQPQYWVSPKDYLHLDSDWTDIPGYTFTTGYPTENAEKLLRRVIRAGSRPGDLVLDFFVGSGTTAVVAQKLGRRWIACDINKGAIQTTSKRLQSVILEQLQQPSLPLASETDAPPPAQLSFGVYRVNDYDLQLQRNEAVQLAMEHVGITPSTADPFFDGTRGKQLAKIIPFERPLTLLDLEGIKQELANRPEETRGVAVVCLGKEMAVDGWLEAWNRWRRAENVPNPIEVIELRTDPRYGKFFVHMPAAARVRVTRMEGKIQVAIEDFISPTIIERLKSEAGLLAPQVEDWRAMVDSVMIDTAYDGQVFNIALADIPEKKDDLVQGVYELDVPAGETTVAVKVTDMLGEEVLEVVVV